MATTENMAGMPQITLEPGTILRFSAISPTTGAAITGVTVSNVSVWGEPFPADTGPTTGPVLPPLFAYAPDNGAEAPGVTR